MTIKLDPILEFCLFWKRNFFLFLFPLLFSQVIFGALSSSKKEFLIKTGLFSDYKMKSGYDPFSPQIFKPYVVGDNFIDYFSDFSFKYKSKRLEARASFSFYKDITTTVLMQRGFNTVNLKLRDSEIGKLSSSRFQWGGYLSHFLFSSLSYFLGFDLKLIQSSAFLPEYLTYKRNLAASFEREILFYFGLFYHNPLGELGFRIPFQVESSSMEGLVSNNFSFEKKPFLSFDLLFKSKKFLGGIAKFSSQFSFVEKRHNKSYYNTRELSGLLQLKLFIKEFFFVDTSSLWVTKTHTFDHSFEEKFSVELKFIAYKFQEISLLYQFLKSSFYQNKDHSSVSQKITLRYSIRLGHIW